MAGYGARCAVYLTVMAGVRRALTAAFEKLNCTLVLLGRLTRRKRAKIPPLPGLWVLFAGIEAVFVDVSLRIIDLVTASW
jgi:hypothetical protein